MRAKRASTVASTSINVLADESTSFSEVGTLEGLLVLPQAHTSNRTKGAKNTVLIICLLLYLKLYPSKKWYLYMVGIVTFCLSHCVIGIRTGRGR